MLNTYQLVRTSQTNHRNVVSTLMKSKKVKKFIVVGTISTVSLSSFLIHNNADATNKEKTNVQSNKASQQVATTTSVEKAIPQKELKQIVKSLDITKVSNSILRPINTRDYSSVTTSGVVKNSDNKNVFQPFNIYNSAAGVKFYSPANSKVMSIQPKRLIMASQINGEQVIFIFKNVATNKNIQVGSTSNKGEVLGTTTGKLKFAVASGYDMNSDKVSNYVDTKAVINSSYSDGYRFNTIDYLNKGNIKALSNAQEETKAKLASAPDYIKHSNVLKGVELSYVEQASLLDSNKIYYSNDVLPLNVIKGGKANVSPSVRALEPIVRKIAQKYNLEDYTEFFLALCQKESGGKASIVSKDAFQSSQSSSGKLNSITSVEKSTEQAIKLFSSLIEINKMNDTMKHSDVRLLIQSYNLGSGLSRDSKIDDVQYNVKYIQDKILNYKKNNKGELATVKNKNGIDWRGDYAYGDFTYTAKFFKIFTPDENWKANYQKEQQKQVSETSKQYTEKSYVINDNAEPVLTDNYQQPNINVNSKNPLKTFENAYPALKGKISAQAIPSLPTSNNLKGLTILLDAGHRNNSYDRGASDRTNPSIHEADIVLQFVLKAKAQLEAQGATVKLIRSSDNEFMDVNQRPLYANQLNVDAYIAFHENASNNSQASGVATLYTKSSDRTFAEAIHSNALPAYQGLMPSKGAHTQNLAVSREANMPSILLETGFVSNDYETAIVTNDAFQYSYVNGIVRGIYDYFGRELPTEKHISEKTKEDKSETTTIPSENKEDTNSKIVDSTNGANEKSTNDSTEQNKTDETVDTDTTIENPAPTNDSKEQDSTDDSVVDNANQPESVDSVKEELDSKEPTSSESVDSTKNDSTTDTQNETPTETNSSTQEKNTPVSDSENTTSEAKENQGNSNPVKVVLKSLLDY